MKHRLITTIALAAVLATTSSYAHDEAAPNVPKNPWSGSYGQFGLNINTGNTDTKNINLAAVLLYAATKWQNKLYGSAQFGSQDSVVQKEIYEAGDQLNYNFSKRTFAFVHVDGLVDKFSPYRYNVSEVLGLGHKLVDTPKYQLTFQAGPGLRQSEVRATNKFLNNMVISTSADFHAHINDKIGFDQSVSGQFGVTGEDLYNIYRSKTAITGQLYKHLLAQVSFSVLSYSKIPAGSKNTIKTDTATTVSIIYKI